jgi:hypothetical protein
VYFFVLYCSDRLFLVSVSQALCNDRLVICYVKSISAEVRRVGSLCEQGDCAQQVWYDFVVAEACLKT